MMDVSASSVVHLPTTRKRIIVLFLLPIVFAGARAYAGGFLELIPDGPPEPYFGGETLQVAVRLYNNDAEDHALRFVQLAFETTTSKLHVGGWFTTAGGLAANRIATWEWDRWQPAGSGLPSTGYNSPAVVYSIAPFDDGTDAALYAGGLFGNGDPGAPTDFAKRDGTDWTAVNNNSLNEHVRAMTVFNDGAGEALFLGGFFTSAGGATLSRIARWSGSAWSPLSTGLNGVAYGLTVFDDGMGPALYACGAFAIAGGQAALRIARWDGAVWTPLGTGLNSWGYVVTAFDDGSGPALYVGGAFTTAGGIAANRVARWDGQSWSALGTGLNDTVYALTVLDDGTGPTLYAGGRFTTAGGVPANRVAKWDGTSWSAVGSGMNNVVYTLAASQHVTRPMLYAGGTFTVAGGIPANHIARWDGSSWSALGEGTNDYVRTLTVTDDEPTPSIIHEPLFAFNCALAECSATGNFELPRYYEAANLPRPFLTYTGSSVSSNMLVIPAFGGDFDLGTIEITLPSQPGTYTLDAVSADDPNPDNDAQIAFGFGVASGDPYTVWHANTGDLEGGTFSFVVHADCNGNSVPDEIDISIGTSRDCNGNAVPDECDIAAGLLTDSDGDLDADICDNCPNISNPDQANSDADGFGNACDNCPNVANSTQQNSDADSLGDACDNCPTASNENQQNSDSDTHGDVCDNCSLVANAGQQDTNGNAVGDACEPPGIPAPPHDAKKNRYISFVPKNVAVPVSFQVTHVASGITQWVVAPAEPLEIANNVGRLQNSAPPVRVWTELVIHVGDCLIAPVNTYEVRPTTDGVVFSPPLTLTTINQPAPKYWGDTVGLFQNNAWTPPNLVVNVNDYNAALKKFQGDPNAPHFTWVDVNGQIPNILINMADVQVLVQANSGSQYPYAAPGYCP